MKAAALALASLALASVLSAQSTTEVTLTGSALIDREISRSWGDAAVTAAGPSTDAEFLRRASLDITGNLPSPDEILHFLSDRAPDKRAAKIDQLLTRPGYAHAWAELWEDILVGYDQQSRNDSKRALYTWLRDEVFAKNLSYDKMVRALLTSNGINTDCGPVNFLLKLSRKDGMGGVTMASKASKVFMSTQIQCAQCHDHPFDRFTQEDFYGMVAFFARTKSKKVEPPTPAPAPAAPAPAATKPAPSPTTPAPSGPTPAPSMPVPAPTVTKPASAPTTPAPSAPAPAPTVTKPAPAAPKPAPAPKDNRFELYDATTGEAAFGEGKAKKNVSPRFLDDQAPEKDLPRREAFAKLLIRPENTLFAKSLVNRYWAHFFGRGIIEPVDDFSNRFKPSHPELLDRLARDFVA